LNGYHKWRINKKTKRDREKEIEVLGVGSVSIEMDRNDPNGITTVEVQLMFLEAQYNLCQSVGWLS